MERVERPQAEADFPLGKRGWWIALLAVLALAATRARGAWYAYGLDGYADEPEVIVPALQAAKGQLRPERFLYPGWTSYSIGATFRALHCVGFGGDAGFLPSEPSPDHFVVGRLFVFATALGSVLAVALAARRAFGAWAGLGAAALLSTSPEFVGMSYLVTVNTPASLWTALTILCALRIYLDGRRWSDYLLAGVCAGFAVGCKYNSYPAVLPIVLAHLFGRRGTDWRHVRLLVAGAVTVLAFIATTPYAVIDHERFVESLRFLNAVYQDQNWPLHTSSSAGSWGAYLERIWRAGWPFELSVAALLGTVWAVRRDWRVPLLVLTAAAANLLFLGFYKVYFLRHLLPALPALAIVSGACVQALAQVGARLVGPRTGARWGSALAAAAIVACGARSLLATEQRVTGKSKIDSRQAAAAWIEQHVPAGARIVCEERSPALGERYQVIHARCITAPEDQTVSLEAQADYFVVTLMSERLIQADPAYAEAREAYRRFAERNELVAEFLGRGEDYSGRDIRVFRVSH